MIELQCIEATVVPPNTSLDARVGDKVPSLTSLIARARPLCTCGRVICQFKAPTEGRLSEQSGWNKCGWAAALSSTHQC